MPPVTRTSDAHVMREMRPEKGVEVSRVDRSQSVTMKMRKVVVAEPHGHQRFFATLECTHQVAMSDVSSPVGRIVGCLKCIPDGVTSITVSDKDLETLRAFDDEYYVWDKGPFLRGVPNSRVQRLMKETPVGARPSARARRNSIRNRLNRTRKTLGRLLKR